MAVRHLIPVLLAAASLAARQTSIKEKKPVFGGACGLCLWEAMADVVQAAMKPYDYDVQICYNCNAADAPRIVSEARMPPPYEPDPTVAEILAPPNGAGPRGHRPILAAALALGCPIWTEDTDFFGCGVATWTSASIGSFLTQ